MVGGLEIEVEFSALGLLELIASLLRSIFLDGCDTVLASLESGVHLGRENHLAVGGLKAEVELSVLCLFDNEFTHL